MYQSVVIRHCHRMFPALRSVGKALFRLVRWGLFLSQSGSGKSLSVSAL